jgi:hypothetical protein
MGITPRFTRQDTDRMTATGLRQIENGILGLLDAVGLKFVTDARNKVKVDMGAFPKGSYGDVTRNLLGSVGYFVLKNGEVVRANVQGSPEGIAAATDMLSTVNKTDYQLIGVAGMEYASYLGAMGYNVITSQAMVALVNLEKLAKKLQEKWRSKSINFDFDYSFTGISSALT